MNLDNKTKVRLVIVGGILLTLGTLSITAIYLPYYSEIGQTNKKISNQTNSNSASASMWKNIDKISKKEN